MLARAALVATMLLAQVASAVSQCGPSSIESSERVVRGKVVAGEVSRKEEWQSWFKPEHPQAILYKFTMQVEGVVKGELAEKTIVIWTPVEWMGYGHFSRLQRAVSDGNSVELDVRAQEGRLVSAKCTYFRAIG